MSEGLRHQFHPDVQKATRESQRLCGKMPLIKRVDDLPHNNRAVLRRPTASHRLYEVLYRRGEERILGHLLARELGHIVRLHRVPEAERLAPYISHETRARTAVQIQDELIPLLGLGLSPETVGAMMIDLHEALIEQPANGPGDLRIERRIRDRYPGLRKMQEVSLTRKVDRGYEAFHSLVRQTVPASIYWPTLAMNAAQAWHVTQLYGRPEQLQPSAAGSDGSRPAASSPSSRVPPLRRSRWGRTATCGLQLTARWVGSRRPGPSPRSPSLRSSRRPPAESRGGPDGNLWFTGANFDQNHLLYIGKVTPSGVVSSYPVPTPDSAPGGIVAGLDGNLWFTEIVGNKIGRITPAGVVSEFPLPTPNSFPQAIPAGPDGNLWFTEASGAIGTIMPVGVQTEYPLAISPGFFQLGSPQGITVGPDGNLWFAEASGISGSLSGFSIGKVTLPTGGSGSLLGDRGVGASPGYNDAGRAEAFLTTVGASGTARQLVLYVDTCSPASQVSVGLYANTAATAPGMLIAQATLAHPVSAAWNAIALPATAITAGTQDWIAVLAPSGAGRLRFRDGGAAGVSQTSAQTALTGLPTTWTPGTTYNSGPLAAYLLADSTLVQPAPPVLLGEPQVGSNQDFSAAGLAEAFQCAASAGGTVSSLSVYVDAASTATRLTVGL
jgi:hypothetical protein